MKITIDGVEFDIPYKRIRLDALFEVANLDPLADKLALIDASRRTTSEFCSLMYVVEIFEGMCFVSCRYKSE